MTESKSDTLSNWGRWGSADERGALNLLTPDVIRNAATLIKTGKTYSLAAPLETSGPQWPLRHKPWKITEHRQSPDGFGWSGDVVTMHSHSVTHMDALCHCWYDHQLFNGFEAKEHVSSNGVARCSIDKVRSIVGRGVLLDVARWKGVDHLALGEPISADDLDRCAAAQQVDIRAGDIVLVRMGWMRLCETDRALFDSGEPGTDASTLTWLKAHDIVAIGADNHAGASSRLA